MDDDISYFLFKGEVYFILTFLIGFIGSIIYMNVSEMLQKAIEAGIICGIFGVLFFFLSFIVKEQDCDKHGQ